jgi:hypothetical protein
MVPGTMPTLVNNYSNIQILSVLVERVIDETHISHTPSPNPYTFSNIPPIGHTSPQTPDPLVPNSSNDTLAALQAQHLELLPIEYSLLLC